MKKLLFDYFMQIQYSAPISDCHFTIKCIPQNTRRQTIAITTLEMTPKTVYREGRDGLGNYQIYGANESPHDTFIFHLQGTARTGQATFEEEESETEAMIFGHPHGLNVPGEAIKAYYAQVEPTVGRDPYRKAVEMMSRLYEEFIYAPGSTSVNTTAEEAFRQGRGVCQDYAHIFIALLHLAGIPARYVTGFILGEGASHAWVEILYHGKWYGLDPTNNSIVSQDHIKIGVGRDAGDAQLNRGVFHGDVFQKQIIKVNVQEL